MTFYIALTPILLASAYMLLTLRALTKHDKVLYAFCDVRRDVMSVLRNHAFELTREDYIALREIEDVTSATIHDYHICKIYLFNFRKFRAAVRRLEGIEVHVNKGLVLAHEIVRLKNDYRRALLFGFFTFTPFPKVGDYANSTARHCYATSKTRRGPCK
jgi:hypothetical protein